MEDRLDFQKASNGMVIEAFSIDRCAALLSVNELIDALSIMQPFGP
jgi:hypothetical protein